MPLHPDARAVIEAVSTVVPPGTMSPAEMRAAFAQSWRPSPDPPAVGRVHERTIPGPAGAIPVRVYVPEGDGPFPTLIWFHGGGWVLGSLDENDTALRSLCRKASVVVISVDYRLAPEHRFPAAADDAYAALVWASRNAGEVEGDGARLAVAGESAGGNLAAVAALMARDRGEPGLALQILVSPIVERPDVFPSYRAFSDGYFLSADSMRWFFTLYPRDESDLDDPYLLPLRAKDLSGLAPALVLTAEYDVLRDEGEEYARRLRAAGVPCTTIRYDGQIHGFFGLLVDQLSVSAQAHDDATRALLRAFSGDPDKSHPSRG